MLYSVQSWCPYNVADKEVLEKVQKRAVGMVSNLNTKTYEDRLQEVGLTTLEARRCRGDLIQMFKIMSGKEAVDYRIWFETLANQRGTNVMTRHSSGLYNVHQGTSNSDLRRNFFSQRICSSWNSLPDYVKSATSVNMFKNRLDEYTNPGTHGYRPHPLP